MRRFIGSGKISDLCKWVQLSKSSFYYHARKEECEAAASTHTQMKGAIVENELVVAPIRAILWRHLVVQ